MSINTPYRRSGANPYKHRVCACFASELEMIWGVKEKSEFVGNRSGTQKRWVPSNQ